MPQYFQESARQVPIVEQTDVLVCGGGPAGVAAAIASARGGARTTLIEVHGCLGGVWTAGLLSWILDAGNKTGLIQELTQHLQARSAQVGSVFNDPRKSGMPYDVEHMKLVLEQLCIQAGVRLRYHTRVVAAVRDESGPFPKLSHVITESKSGRQAWSAKVFIDCTGDGDLAAQAGCGFDYGRPLEGPGSLGPQRAGETQPLTLMCLIDGVERDATSAFHERLGRPWHESKDALLAEFQKAGVTPSYTHPTMFEIYPDLYALMINHEYGYNGIDADHLTTATIHARAEINQLLDGLRSLGGCWKNLRLIATANQIGVREGRRIHGRYTLTLDDMLRGARFEDAVCRVTFGIDVHSTNKAHNTGIEASQGKGKTQPYDIPLRSLIAKDVDGLLMAGRCISGDFLAHSSYRVTGNAVAMGQATGQLAAQAIKQNGLPHQVTR